MDVTWSLALLAGVVSFASPCFLPIVPAYVGYVVGEGPSRRSSALGLSLSFVAGFTVVFVGFWVALGLIGYALGDYRSLLRVGGGVLLVLLGLHVARLVQFSVLYRKFGFHPRTPTGEAPSHRRAALLGVGFAAGWSPCIGPVLGGVIGLASTRGSVLEGAVLLLTYAFGLGLPFVAVAVGFDQVRTKLRWLLRHERVVSLGSGVVLIGIGFLMITGTFDQLAARVPSFGL